MACVSPSSWDPPGRDRVAGRSVVEPRTRLESSTEISMTSTRNRPCCARAVIRGSAARSPACPAAPGSRSRCNGGSLGWACPASFGYAMGLEADRRLVSAIGDGSFQLTSQEVANMIRHGQET